MELHLACDDLKRRIPATGAIPQQPVFVELAIGSRMHTWKWRIAWASCESS
jgi:hypothetical protein